MSEPTTPFPPLLLDQTPPWQWPAPPGPRRHLPPPEIGAPQPCRVEAPAGTDLHADLIGFDPGTRRLTLRTDAHGPEVSLPFARIRRLSLNTPLQPTPRPPGGPRKRLPAAAQERDYSLQQVGQVPVPALSGRTAGYVETAEGMFLFAPLGDDGALQRQFVPRAAYSRCEFGASAEELAARHWIASPAKLLEAIARQQRAPVVPLGQALLALGLLTQLQLDRHLAALDGKAALGESLMSAGLVSRADLQTALAHKMGYPLVDLARFPIDPAALATLPPAVAVAHRVLPLMRDRERLIVAVDRPGRVLKLRRLDAYAQCPIAPVLALKAQLLAALDRGDAGAAWSDDATDHMDLIDSVN